MYTRTYVYISTPYTCVYLCIRASPPAHTPVHHTSGRATAVSAWPRMLVFTSKSLWNFKYSRGSNPRTIASLLFEMPFESWNLPGAEPGIPDCSWWGARHGGVGLAADELREDLAFAPGALELGGASRQGLADERTRVAGTLRGHLLVAPSW